MPKQPNPDNADSPQQIGDRINAAAKSDPNPPAHLQQKDPPGSG